MAGIQASVSYSETLSKAETRAHSDPFQLSGALGNMNYVFGRNPDYFVYVYNVSELEMVVSRPPLFDQLKLAAKPAGTNDYVLVAKFPQPILTPKGNVDSNEIEFVQNDARAFVMDLINPDNRTTNQDAVVQSTSKGTNDLGRRGLFWSLNGPGASKYGYLEAPTEAEVKSAHERLKKHYRQILNDMKAMEISNPALMHETLAPEHHIAAEYFGESYSWHQKQVRVEYCETCGEKCRAGAKFHRLEDGGMCVRSWPDAIKAGVRTRAQAFEATGDESYLLPAQRDKKLENKIQSNIPTE